ncbi:endonuclease [Bifidobacterium ramosum]|uniref:UPF0102 protein DSM100688_0335 n=1 Tax=Bifidobacterium ramosum TaxID=1798158 RepID=A0A6L4X2Q0_9BIFI|nr:YraN family protein [Bifidobacterium ramosum]KAB8289255.1 endonuclease [Bifidobacterium ramosum]NEG70961.1 YraN family protein [Bifidobacterium ramosum]
MTIAITTSQTTISPTSTTGELAARLADPTLDPKRLGSLGEDYAALWLQRQGCTILDRNWRTRYGEIDLIALTHQRVILFVEVKTRRSTRFGVPQEAVTARKRMGLRRAGVQWLTDPEHRFAHRGVRFDVIAITVPSHGQPAVNHIREAF